MSKIDAAEVPWWKKTSVYQIYPRSYMDSTGNGIGDLKGIISKLDYIKETGFETIWFSPFYESPTFRPYKDHDCGYDIMNYRGINPEYGDMDIADELIKEVHARDMKIVLDMVMNHTSDAHPWFVESRSSKDNPKRDWYIWKDGKKPTKKRPGGSKPPNNWQAMITGSAWNYDTKTDQYYYAQFLPFQPDLNYRNPEVQEEMLDTVRYWLKKNVDGFRLDIVNALFEDAEFRDSPFCWKVLPSEDDERHAFRDPKYVLNHPDTLDFMMKLRSTIDEFKDPARFMVGEVSASLDTLKKYLGPNGDGLNLVFLFKGITTPLKQKKIKELLESYEKNFPDPFWPTWVVGNHDRGRRISRLGNDVNKAKLSAALQLTSRGTPFTYYGEEIGMENGFTHKKESRDAVVDHFGWVPQWLHSIVNKVSGEIINRDLCRTPMQWDGSENAGFSTTGGNLWLPLTKSYKTRNVAVQMAEEDSILNCYKRFLKARKDYPSLTAGSLRVLKLENAPKSVLAFERSANVDGKEQIINVFFNFSEKDVIVPNSMKNGEMIVSTTINSDPIAGARLILKPWECAAILEK